MAHPNLNPPRRSSFFPAKLYDRMFDHLHLAGIPVQRISGAQLGNLPVSQRSQRRRRRAWSQQLCIKQRLCRSDPRTTQWQKHAPGLKTMEDATNIRRRILRAFELAEQADDAERRACMTFVIVGGGPTGCELAGALAEVAYKTMAGDFRSIDPKACRILLIEPSDQPLRQYPDPLPDGQPKHLKNSASR